MSDKPNRRPPADSLPTEPEGRPSPAPESAKGEAERYTVANLEGWVAELRTIPQLGKLNGSQLEAIDRAAAFLEDTAGTLRAQARIRRDREAARIIANRKANRGRRRQ